MNRLSPPAAVVQAAREHLSNLSPDRASCLAYKKGRGSVGKARIGFAAIQADTRSGPGRTHPRVAGAHAMRSPLASAPYFKTAMPIELNDRDAKRGARLSTRKDRAEWHATVLAPIIAEIRAAGVTSLYGITKALNARGVPTATGKGKWQDIGVRRVLARLKHSPPSV